MYASRQHTGFKRVFTMITTILIILLEAGRIVWRYFYLQNNGESLSFVNVTNLDFFTLSCWISIPLIFIACIVKKRNKGNIRGLAFVFFVSSIIGVVNLIYPTFLNGNFDFYHLYNLSSVLIRSFIIMLGFFFVLSRWIVVNRFLNLWKSFFSLVFFGLLCMGLYVLLGTPENLFYLEYVPLFESLGIYLVFPFQFILICIFIFALQFLFFIPFYTHEKKKNQY